jgi:hypothetical protein
MLTYQVVFDGWTMLLQDAKEHTYDSVAIKLDQPGAAAQTIDRWGSRFGFDVTIAKRELDSYLKHAQLYSEIAKMQLGISTLQSRGRDRYDFHEVSVWQLRAALEQAFHAGRAWPKTPEA